MIHYQPLRSPTRNRSYTILFAIFLIFIFTYKNMYYDPDYDQYYGLLETDTCRLPELDPWDPSVLPYVKTPDPLICKKLQPELTYLSEAGHIEFNLTELQISKYNLTSLKCSYRCFDKKYGDDDTLDYGSWMDLQNGTKQDCEFAEVNCRKLFPPLSIYSNLHARVIPKEEIVLKNKDHKKRPNVILFVLDSVSEANWRRSLPKTLKVLLEDYKSTVFKGFNKVGDNSFPNAVAFLTGKRVMAPGHQSELPDDMSKSFFDDWPLIWNDYSKHNYATFYAEDLIKYNLFYYLSNGFRGKPVDHYFRPYWVRIYETFLYRRSTPMCFGNKPSHMVQLEYLKSIIMAYKSKAPIFALHWLTELGHDWSNQVGLGDDDIASFFKNQKENLKNSYVFVFSDHGHRFDSIRQTMNGRIEERLPFFSVHVPESEIERNKELKGILQRNAKKLTSFWDLHATLLDILSEAPPYNAHNGHSLFKDLPEDRNCQSAHIPEEECVCQREIHINVSDPNVSKAAACLIAHINNLLPQNCSQLKVANIKQAQMVLPSKTIALGIPSASFFTRPGPVYVNYRVTLEASPSEAIFEGVVKNALKEDNFEVVGDISRINKYGNQSSCVNSPTLKKFCFCVL